jgi:hypothetical protein
VRTGCPEADCFSRKRSASFSRSKPAAANKAAWALRTSPTIGSTHGDFISFSSCTAFLSSSHKLIRRAEHRCFIFLGIAAPLRLLSERNRRIRISFIALTLFPKSGSMRKFDGQGIHRCKMPVTDVMGSAQRSREGDIRPTNQKLMSFAAESSGGMERGLDSRPHLFFQSARRASRSRGTTARAGRFCKASFSAKSIFSRARRRKSMP